MKNKRAPSELEQRLTLEVLSKAADKERIDAVKNSARDYQLLKASGQIAARKNRETQNRQITWFARIAAIPLTIFACVYLSGIVLDLFNGEVFEISKSRHSKISIQHTPIMFWFALTYHLSIAALISFSAYRCWQRTKWFDSHT